MKYSVHNSQNYRLHRLYSKIYNLKCQLLLQYMNWNNSTYPLNILSLSEVYQGSLLTMKKLTVQ